MEGRCQKSEVGDQSKEIGIWTHTVIRIQIFFFPHTTYISLFQRLY